MSRSDEVLALAREAISTAYALDAAPVVPAEPLTPRSAALFLASKLADPGSVEELQEVGVAVGIVLQAKAEFEARFEEPTETATEPIEGGD